MNSRLDYLKEKLKYQKIDGMIVTNPISIYYLIGVKEEGILIISKYQNTFLTNYRYIDEITKKITLDTDIILEPIEKCINYDFFDLDDVVGIEEDNISYLQYELMKKKFKVELVGTNYIIEKMREVKEENEIEIEQELAKILDNVVEDIKPKLRSGAKEKNIEYKIANDLKNLNVDIVNIRVSFGINSSKEYLKPTSMQLNKNDIVIIQIAIKRYEYIAKIARTFLVLEDVNALTKDEKEKFEKIKKAYSSLEIIYDEMFKNIRNNINISQIYSYISDMLEKISWNISYNIGSGIGLEEKEFPEIIKANFNSFRENMVLDLSPQVYFENEFGLIIEDTVRLTRNNIISLTKASRDLEINNK